jgi:hypothetical protein
MYGPNSCVIRQNEIVSLVALCSLTGDEKAGSTGDRFTSFSNSGGRRDRDECLGSVTAFVLFLMDHNAFESKKYDVPRSDVDRLEDDDSRRGS